MKTDCDCSLAELIVGLLALDDQLYGEIAHAVEKTAQCYVC